MNSSAEQITHTIRNRKWRDIRKTRRQRIFIILEDELNELERLASKQYVVPKINRG